MLGRLEMGGRRAGAGELYGLPVVYSHWEPEGLFPEWRLSRAAAGLRRQGVGTVLAGREFPRWETLSRRGLGRVDPGALLRGLGARLALAGLERRELDPARSVVALVGCRARGELARSAAALCPRVRRLVIDAPDGQEVACRLREQFGIPVLPARHPAQLELRFHSTPVPPRAPVLELYGYAPELDGGRLRAPWLAGEDAEDLELICALWQRGRLDAGALKFP